MQVQSEEISTEPTLSSEVKVQYHHNINFIYMSCNVYMYDIVYMCVVYTYLCPF